MSDWKPISSPPINGDWVLVYADGAYNCAFVDSIGEIWDWTNPATPNVLPGAVTHWMPLPPAPEGME